MVIKMLKEKTRYHFDNTYIDSPLRFGSVYMLQIGRRYCEVASFVRAHSHANWFELTVVTGGCGSVFANGEGCPVQPHDIYLSFPGDIHEIRATEGEKLEYDYLSFRTDDSGLNEQLEMIIRTRRDSLSRRFRDDKISFLINCALSEFTGERELSSELLGSCFKQIIVYLIRDFSDSLQKTVGVSEAYILCQQLMSHIDAHIYSSDPLPDLAEKFSYNYSYLSALFRKTTGKKLSEYCRERKMETAKVLLLEGKKVSEISQLLGYSSPFAFSRAFSEWSGVSPKEFRGNSGR